jgi:hypothetical protein
MKELSSNTSNDVTLTQMPNMINLLKYWTGFSMLVVFEYVLSTVFSFFFMSVFYNAIKLAGFIMLLQNNDALLMLHGLVLVPLFDNYETYMDQLFTTLESKAHTFRGIPGNEQVNYNIYNYMEPYLSKVPYIGQFVLASSNVKRKKLE